MLKGVLSRLRPVCAAIVALALVTGNLAACAGWTATPEARMACCLDEAACPMHAAVPRDGEAERAISQADADSCCAASEREQSSQSSPAFVLASALTPVAGPIALLAATALPHDTIWLSHVPIVAAATPTHLLLSVFLV